jgi:hypothetical protein
MWMLENTTPYAAERNWTRDKRGAQHWLVAVKATFEIQPDGALKLADEQAPPVMAPEYHGEPGRSSLKLDSDLLAAKPGTDIVADASAHAPRGKAAPVVPVSMRVGEVHKQLLVHGNRVYYAGGLSGGLTMTAPEPFVTRPIRYEWAYGGSDMADSDPRRHRMDMRNPIGKGFTTQPSRLEHQPVPAIEYLGGDASKLGPAGYGPIDAAWSPRRELAGTYDDAWAARKKPLLPDDYDERYALSAPADQRPSTGYLHGGEPVELLNLTPGGVLRFELPKIYLTFATAIGKRREEHRSKLASVILLPEASRVALVWQSTLPVRARDVDYLDSTVIGEKPYLT